MPQYEYVCRSCKKITEKDFSLGDMKQKIKCSCGKIAVKYFSSVPVHFKSRGFPGNDSKKKSRGNQVVDNKIEDLFDDHNYGKKYGEQKDHWNLNKG